MLLQIDRKYFLGVVVGMLRWGTRSHLLLKHVSAPLQASMPGAHLTAATQDMHRQADASCYQTKTAPLPGYSFEDGRLRGRALTNKALMHFQVHLRC